MIEIIFSVLVISSIGAGLALLLVIAEKFIANYGECEIDINQKKQLKVQGGKPLLTELINEKIFIPSACGGKGTCGYCKVKVLEGAGLLLPTETPFLTEQEQMEDIRLSCQVKVRNDIKIVIPEELFSVQEYTCQCTKIVDLTHDIKLFRFELIEPTTIEFVPGQYVQFLTPVYMPRGEEVYRAYSIASDPNEKNAIELIIRLVPEGICTTYCFEHLKVGGEVKVNGPYGDFHMSDSDSEMIFIAGGSGMAPLKSILHHMKNTGCKRKATYYFGANMLSEMFMVDLMRDFEKELADFRFVPVIATPEEGQNWEGETGLVTHAVNRYVNNASQCESYLCGSPGMIDASIKVLCELGMSEDDIYYDKFA
ncbi:MAG TPA: 2Fe-2S iron-sulfur cluster binding domain-containing protein [Phycisphaerales bacterium]|nr:2Fe-2S iron-sulfur cluster binding domain-containing protein [Phycisphaerales bacterium]